MKGTIRKVVRDKGFGFIKGADNKDYFFHRSLVGGRVRFDSVQEGDSVEFTPTDSDKGPRAESVEVV